MRVRNEESAWTGFGYGWAIHTSRFFELLRSQLGAEFATHPLLGGEPLDIEMQIAARLCRLGRHVDVEDTHLGYGRQGVGETGPVILGPTEHKVPAERKAERLARLDREWLAVEIPNLQIA